MDVRYTTQLASDIQRDGMAVELISEDGHVVGEIFRSDKSGEILFSLYKSDVPLLAIEILLARAKNEFNR